MRRVVRFVMRAFLLRDMPGGYYDLTGIPTADPHGFWDFVWPRAPGNGFQHGVRRLVAALPFQHGIFVNRPGKTVEIPFQLQVKSPQQSIVVPVAKLPVKESGDESPHSKGRLFSD